MPLIVTLILSTLAVRILPVQASNSVETLALSPDTIHVKKDSEPAGWPNFDVEVKITNVTNVIAVTFSAHWDPSILDLTSVVKGDFLDDPGTTVWKIGPTIDHEAGDAKECAITQLTPYYPKNYTDPDWGLVATLKFTFVGTAPSAGENITTTITFVDNPAADMDTMCRSYGEPVAGHNFDVLGTCEFTYIGPPVMLTIRPNAPGTFTEWTAYPTAPNWQCVDEETRNNDTDFVYVNATEKADSYNLQNTALTGNISNVTVNIYAKQTIGNEKAKLMLVINGTKYYGSEYVPGTEYALYMSDWANNPATNLSWTWSDINALEAGQESLEVVTPGQDIYPIENMNFTDTGSTAWITTTAVTLGTAEYGYDTLDGNPSGSGAPSYFHKSTSSPAKAGSATFVTEQNFSYTVGQPSSSYLSYAYKVSGNSIGASTLYVILVKPDNTTTTLQTIPISAGTPVAWTYNTVSIPTTEFTQNGTYKLQLKSDLAAAVKGTANYIQVNWDDVGLKITTPPIGWQGEMRVTQLYVEITYTPVVGFDLNLRVMDWDLIDNILGAYVYMNSDVKISDANGWANWTNLSGTVQIKVKWYGFWVNGTSVNVDSNKTIDLQCKIFDIEVTCIEGVQGAFLQYVNVTVYNASSVAGNMIRTGITGPDGKVSLANVPNATLTFTCYDGDSPQNVIANVTRTITAENQTETITCDQNYISTTHTWGIIGIYSSALCLGLILLLGFATGKPSRMLNCLKERIKKVRSKQKKRKGGRKNT